jgi:hypothetical protein
MINACQVFLSIFYPNTRISKSQISEKPDSSAPSRGKRKEKEGIKKETIQVSAFKVHIVGPARAAIVHAIYTPTHLHLRIGLNIPKQSTVQRSITRAFLRRGSFCARWRAWATPTR